MGLFDRFRMKIKQANEDYGITAEDGSAEAEQALQNRLSLEEDIRRTREQEDSGKEGNSKTVPRANGTNLKTKSKTRSKNQVVPRKEARSKRSGTKRCRKPLTTSNRE